MKTSLVKALTPEEKELKRKQAELARLESELAQRELDLATLYAELHAFEQKYLRMVGARYAELDEIEAQIAEALAKKKRGDSKAQKEATQARARAQESGEAVGEAQKSDKPTEFKSSEDLKKTYRELAKRIHPDLATDDKERERRQGLMKEANAAYEEGDEERLLKILEEWETSPESVKGEGAGAELVRVIRKIAQVRNRLAEIKSEIKQLQESELYTLKKQVQTARRKGRDLLAEIQATLEERIKEARGRLRQLLREASRHER
jgi:peptidoglycan hydrolase CwlO-like protein